MTIISELLFSVGKSILVLVSSRICPHQAAFRSAVAAGNERQKAERTFLMLAPPLPMMFLWNCLKMGTDREKLFSIWKSEGKRERGEGGRRGGRKSNGPARR